MLKFIPSQPVSSFNRDVSTAPEVQHVAARQTPHPAIAAIKAAARRLAYTSEIAALPPWSLRKDLVKAVIAKVAPQINDSRPPHWTTVVRWYRTTKLKPKQTVQIPSSYQVDHSTVDLPLSDRWYGAPGPLDPRQKSSIERVFAQVGPTAARRLRLRDLSATVVGDRAPELMRRHLHAGTPHNRVRLERRTPLTLARPTTRRNISVSLLQCDGGFLEVKVTVDPHSRAITEMHTRFVPSGS